MTASRIFLYFCLCFVGGIFLSSFLEISQAVLLGFLILGIFLISIFWSYKKLAVVGFCLLFFNSWYLAPPAGLSRDRLSGRTGDYFHRHCSG